MRYKTLILSLAIAGLLFVWAGCDSFLEPDPKSFSTTANFYNQPEHFEQAINGAYTQFRSLVHPDIYRNATDRRGPTLTKHFDVNLPHTVSGDPQTDEFTMVASNGNSIDLWNLTYDLVNQANVILTRIDDVEFEDAALKDRIVGEAKTLRAFAYWFAVQTWGGVPIVTQDARTPEEGIPEGGRASAEEVYQQIVTDLQDAIAGLPITHEGGAGRITRGAAKFLLGRTYLLTGDYQAALSEFEDLDGGDYSYTLLSDYREVFNPANKNNAESILEVQYNPDLSGQPALDMFNEILPINSGEDLLPPERPVFVPDGNIMPTPDVIASYESGDERFEASIAWYVDEENSSYPEIAWPPRTATSAAGDSLPYLNKFYWPGQVTSSGEPLNNWIVFRFADVLLSAAEAHWRLGNDAEAINYVDRVRARADLSPVDLGNVPQPGHPDYPWLAGTELENDAVGRAIFNERAIELLGEGHMWFDLKRFGSDLTIDVMTAHGEYFRARDNKVTNDMYVIEEYKLLYPIPPGEIDLADLEQNPGW